MRPERRGEQPLVRSVNLAAFDGSLEADIVDAIRHTDRWIEGGSLVAEAGAGLVVGHLLLSEGDLLPEGDGDIDRIWMVGPVAVAPAYQRRGVGTALMEAAIGLATARRQPVLCLLGHADWYPRFGFRPARSLGIAPPRAWPDENWMALPLPDWDPTVAGVASYPPAFPDSQAVPLQHA